MVGGEVRVGDEYGEGDDEGNTVIVSDNADSLEELQFGRDQGVGPTGHEERRRKWVDAFTSDEGNLRTG